MPAVALFAVALASAPGLAAQRLVGIGRGGGDFGGSYEANRWQDRGGPGSGGDDYRFWFGLPLAGNLLGRRFFSYDVVLQPTWTWQHRTGFAAVQRLRQVNLSFAVNAFDSKPVGLSANGSSFSAIAAGGLGGTREYALSNRSAQLWVRFRPLPVHLNLHRQALDETWRTPGAVSPARSATIQRVLRVSASNSKLNVDAQRLEHQDLLGDRGYTAWGLRALHVARWGRSSRLESSYESSSQDGVFPYRRKEWRERLELNHGGGVRTEYAWSNSENGNPVAAVSNRFLSGGATVALAPGATVGALVSRTTSRSGAAREEVSVLAPRGSLWLGSANSLQVSGNVSLGLESRRVAGVAAAAAVLDESHEVPASRFVTLDHPDALPTGILVRKLDGPLIYLEGLDYEVLPLDRFLGLRIPPASRIAVGERILVSYTYRVRAEGRRAALRGDLGLAITYRGLRLQHQRALKRSVGGGMLPEAAVVPSDFDESNTTVSLRTGSPIGRLEGAAGWRTREREPQRTEDLEFSLALIPGPVGPVTSSVSLLWSSARTTQRRQDGWTLSAAATGAVMRGLSVGSVLEIGMLSQSDAGGLRYRTNRLTAAWQLDRITLEAGLDLYQQSRPVSRATGRLSLRVARRF